MAKGRGSRLKAAVVSKHWQLYSYLPWLHHQSVLPRPERAGGKVQLNKDPENKEERKLDLAMVCSLKKALLSHRRAENLTSADGRLERKSECISN